MCGGGRSAPPPAPAPEAPKKSDAEVQAAEEALSASERRRQGRESTILTSGEGVSMEQVRRRKLMGTAAEKLGT